MLVLIFSISWPFCAMMEDVSVGGGPAVYKKRLGKGTKKRDMEGRQGNVRLTRKGEEMMKDSRGGMGGIWICFNQSLKPEPLDRERREEGSGRAKRRVFSGCKARKYLGQLRDGGGGAV